MDDQAVAETAAYAIATEFYEDRKVALRFARSLIYLHSIQKIDLLAEYDVALARAKVLWDALDETVGGPGGVKLLPRIEDPCPADGRHGHHELYSAGPGGKRGPSKENWQCCQACGANGSTAPKGINGYADGDVLTTEFGFKPGTVMVIGGRTSGKTKAMKEAAEKARAEGKTVVEVKVGSMSTKGANSPNVVVGDFHARPKSSRKGK